MKVEFVEKQSEEVSLGTLKPGDWFLCDCLIGDPNPMAYCFIDASSIEDSITCFEAGTSCLIHLPGNRKVIPIDASLKISLAQLPTNKEE